MRKECFHPDLMLPAKYMVELCEAEPPTSWLYEDLVEVCLLPKARVEDVEDAVKLLDAAGMMFNHLYECEKCGWMECPEPVEETREWYRNYHMYVWACMRLIMLKEKMKDELVLSADDGGAQKG